MTHASTPGSLEQRAPFGPAALDGIRQSRAERPSVVVAALVGLVLVACQSLPPTPLAARGASAAATSAQPTAPNAKSGGTVTVALDQEPLTLYPHATNLGITYFITSSVGESLLYLDEHHELKPWLADTWEVGGGGTDFTFKLRADVMFQDGTRFNAAAVKWNLDHIVDPAFKAGGVLSQLVGYQGTEVVDEFTARVRFARPFVPFLIYAGSPGLAMVSPTAAASRGERVNQSPVMSGPYKIDEWVLKDHVTISRWDGYHRQAPWSEHPGPGYLDKVVFRFIPEAGTRATTVESGETQLATVFTPQDVARLTAAGLQIAGSAWGGAPLNLLLNVTLAPTDDQRVRQAIAYAINAEALLTSVYLGSRAIGPLTAGLLDDASLRTSARPDLVKASQLLDQAGWISGQDGVRAKNGQRLEFVLNSSAAGTSGGPYEILQAQLRQVGIDVKIKAQAPLAAAEDNVHCANNGALDRRTTNELDVLYQSYHSTNVGGNSNFACLKDPEVDLLLEQGRQEVDPARRRSVYLQLEQTLMDLAAVVPLVDQVNTFALRSNVHGLKFNGASFPLVTDLFVTP